MLLIPIQYSKGFFHGTKKGLLAVQVGVDTYYPTETGYEKAIGKDIPKGFKVNGVPYKATYYKGRIIYKDFVSMITNFRNVKGMDADFYNVKSMEDATESLLCILI